VADDALPEGVFFDRPKTAEEKQQEYKKNAPSPLPEGTFFERPKGEKLPVSGFYDAGMGAASGLTKGVAGLPGMVGGISQASDWLQAKALEKLGILPKGKTAEDLLASANKLSETPAEKAGYVTRVLGVPVPTPSGAIKGAEDLTSAAGVNIKPLTKFDPQTGPGRISQGVAEFLPGALVGPGGMGTKLISGIGGGVAGQGLKEGARNLGFSPEWQTAAELSGSVLGGVAFPTLASSAARSLGYADKQALETAQRIAGQIGRESVDNAQDTINTLSERINAISNNPELFVSGVNFTPAQILKSGQFKDLENQVAALANSEEKRLLEAQLVNAENRLTRQAKGTADLSGQNIPEVDVGAAINLSGNNPQGTAAIAGRGAFDALHAAKKSASNLAWENPLLKQTNVYKDKTLNSIKEHLGDIGLTDRSRIDPEVTNLINTFKKSEGSTIPLMDVQNLRAMVGDKSRRAYASNEPALGKIHQDLATKLHDLLADSTNMQFGDASGAKFAAWDQARAATKDYYDTFRPDFMGKLAAENAGAPVISSEAFFDKMFSGQNSAQNLRQIRSAMGPSIDSHVSDWVIGDITNNGNVNTTNKQIERYISNPKNAAIIDEVPGLKDRVNNLLQKVGESEESVRLRRVSDLFNRAASSEDPKIISDFLGSNRQDIKSLFTDPAEKRFIDALYNTSSLLAPANRGVASYSKMLNSLQNGRMIDILLGGKMGFLSDVAIAEILYRGASALAGVPGLAGLGAGAAATAKGIARSQPVSAISQKVSSLMFGDIKGLTIQQLQEMVKDPVTARLLMSKPSPEAAMNFHKRLMAMGLGLEQTSAIENKPDQNRRVRASGGRISTSSLGDKLVLAAERAKKENSKATEPLLNVNDESIAKALEIANRNL
jgi:hypothetical protein